MPSADVPDRKKAVSVGAGDEGLQPETEEMKAAPAAEHEAHMLPPKL